jgi:acyl dehydratase
MPDALTHRLDHDGLLSRPADENLQSYGAAETILYHLGIGFGAAAAADASQLRYVLERDLTVFPTMAAVLGVEHGLYQKADYGIDFAGILHGEEALEMLHPIPPVGQVRGRGKVEGIWDLGPQKGAVMTVSKSLQDARTGTLLAVCRSTMVLRRNGGFGGSASGAPRPVPVPERDPDGMFDIATRPEQALIYRLSGDRNPLHAEPHVAAQAGFPAPILHGLCSFAIAARALVAAEAGGDADRLKNFSVRFSKPAFPGETIRLSFWRLGQGAYALNASSVERNVVLLSGGQARLAAA